MYDLIGDIHGHADELVQLLEVLGYQMAQGAYRHPERKVIFLGDFIDRGPKIRQVVHACWDEGAITPIAQALTEHRGLTSEFFQYACKKGNALFTQVEIVLKGKEAALPEGEWFLDPDGHRRTEIRSRWYLSPVGQTYRTYALQSDVKALCDLELDASVIGEAVPYPKTAKPVFVGHYWLSANRPQLLADNVACLDYSVANGGFLCAYRRNGEQTLNNKNFVWVSGGR